MSRYDFVVDVRWHGQYRSVYSFKRAALKMEQWKGRVTIVTGASSGIGREVAKQLALNGMIVIGCARNQSRIEVRIDREMLVVL